MTSQLRTDQVKLGKVELDSSGQLFWTQHFVWMQNLFDPNLFYLNTKYFLSWILYLTKYFLKFLFTKNCKKKNTKKNSFWAPTFFGPTLLGSKIFLDQSIIAKFSFNFNFNLVGSWYSLIPNFLSHPPTPTRESFFKQLNLT